VIRLAAIILGVLSAASFAIATWLLYGRHPNDLRVVLGFRIEREADGQWLATTTSLPGVHARGTTRRDAVTRAQALALRALADRVDRGEALP
jgi:predicted RNase H-like HicB family nuclease